MRMQEESSLLRPSLSQRRQEVSSGLGPHNFLPVGLGESQKLLGRVQEPPNVTDSLKKVKPRAEGSGLPTTSGHPLVLPIA